MTYDIEAKYIPEHERATVPSEDFAGPHRSYPIRNQDDVFNAAHLIGHAADPNAVRTAIIRIAKRKGLALPESWQQHIGGKNMTETLVYFGSEVKALGDGKVGGYLIRFGDASNTDLVGDFFTQETNFGPHKNSVVLYQHGMDYMFKNRVLDDGAVLRNDEVGVWIEAQLALRDDYERAINGMVKAGKCGWSSGTASHLVEREPVGKAYHIKSWPLGLDASITPNPAEPRTTAISLKSLDFHKSGLLTGLDYDDHSDMVLTASREYVDRAEKYIMRRLREGKSICSERIDALKSIGVDIARLIDAAKPRATDAEMNDLKSEIARLEGEFAQLIGA